MIDIIPGVFEKEWGELERKVILVSPHVDWVQIDIADNTLVPVTSVLDFVKMKGLIASYTKLSFEAHLMVANPEKYSKQLADCGFKRLIAHVESQDPRRFLDEATYESVEVGMAIDGPTELEHLEPFLEEVDSVLVMMAEAGASGLTLQPENVDKIRILHRNYPDLPIEVDEGINEITARIVKDAGATRLVTTSYLFNDPVHIASAIARLKEA